ncbi:MAG: 4-hydroxy-tetrahydrodipicolinate reductase [Nitrospirae bacterium]|nr:4-hydroxy-tetrahydrodipicolinate reductase [Nitrospirota bacterium]
MKTVKAVVTGAAGRMGWRIISLIRETPGIELAGALERTGHPSVGSDAGEIAGCGRTGIVITDDLADILRDADLYIDFSVPHASVENLRTAASLGKAAIIGTTGFGPEEIEEIGSLSRDVPCVLSPNFSIGVNVVFQLIAEAAKRLGNDYDVEIIEAHHRHKKDAPSGTAMRMAQILAEALGRDLNKVGKYARHGIIGERDPKEIGIQTIRGGDIVGDHTVYFAGLGETVSITHRAQSRDNFARGAIRAALWIAGKKPGLYDMGDVLGL